MNLPFLTFVFLVCSFVSVAFFYAIPSFLSLFLVCVFFFGTMILFGRMADELRRLEDEG